MKQIGFLLLAVFAWSCAQQGAPTGGPKDVTPPKIVNSIPTNFSTNIHSRTIVLEFDEYVMSRGLVNEMIISPPVEETPKFWFKGMQFYLQFKEDLQDSVTYQINFGEGLVDYNEGNPLDSNVFVFSTGNYLDSLEVSGKLVGAFDLSPQKDMLVMLYNNLSDSIPCKQKPNYFTRSKEDGTYRLSYIKNQSYQLFALDDKNSNFMYDLPNERIAFLGTTFNLQKDTAYNLYMFEEDNKKQYLKSLKLENPYKLVAVFNLPVKSPVLSSYNKSFKRAWYSLDGFREKDTAVFWVAEPFGLDTMRLQVYDQQELLDSSEVVFPDSVDKKYTLKLSGLKNQSNIPPFYPIAFNANFPVLSFDTSMVHLIKDSVEVGCSLVPKAGQRPQLLLKRDWKEEESYQLIIEDSALLSYNGIFNDSIDLRFSIRPKSQFVDLEIAIKNTPPDVSAFVLELMDKSAKQVVRDTAISDTATTFPKMPLGPYMLKLTLDNNGDGKWTTGHYGKKRQPEKTYFYEGGIELKENFDTRIEWDLDEKPSPQEDEAE